MAAQLPTIDDLFLSLKRFGAATGSFVVRDENDKPVRAVIVVEGEETQEIIDAVDAVVESWD